MSATAFNAHTFRQVSSAHLKEYLQRCAVAVEHLTTQQVWWKPHTAALSIGIILTHLNGNITQWILSGLGGDKDDRDRASEFTDQPSTTKQTLLKNFSQTISRACVIIEGLSDEDLATEVCIQDFKSNKMAAVYHVVEHCSWHSGQLVWIAKLLMGADHNIAFYDNDKLNAAKNR